MYLISCQVTSLKVVQFKNWRQTVVSKTKLFKLMNAGLNDDIIMIAPLSCNEKNFQVMLCYVMLLCCVVL